MKLSALMALLSPAPTVHVHAVDDTAEAAVELRGWVAARLLQERYTVVPTEADAGWTVTVQRVPEGWALRVRGRESVEETIPSAADGIARLELLHRTVEALERVESAAVSSLVPPPLLRLHIAEPTGSGAGLELETRVVANVLDQGVALSGDSGPVEGTLCVGRIEGDSVRMALGGAEDLCDPVVADAVSVSLEQLETRIAALLPRVAQSERKAESEPPDADDAELNAEDESASISEPKRSGPDVPIPTRPRPRPRPRPRHGAWRDQARVLRAGVAGGLVSRLRPVDAAAGAHARFGREPGVGVRAEVELWPSVHDALRVIEVAPAVGIEGRVVSTELLAFDIGAVVGPVFHRYAITNGPAGTRADWNLGLPLTLSFRIVSGLEGSLGFRIARSGRARSHVIDGDEAWSRGAWRIGAMLGVAWQWRLR